MEKNFVPYKLAKKLAEKLFDDRCFTVYKKTGLLFLCDDWSAGFNKSEINREWMDCLAPTWDQAMKWFRERHQIFIDILTDCTSYPKYSFDIAKFTGNPKDLTEREWFWEIDRAQFLYRDYYEALTEAIEKALTLI